MICTLGETPQSFNVAASGGDETFIQKQNTCCIIHQLAANLIHPYLVLKTHILFLAISFI